MRNFTKMKFWLLLMVMGVLTSATVIAQPKLDVTPDPLNLGDWPIGGWQESAYLTLENAGTGVITVTASDLDDPNGVFAVSSLSLPMELSQLGDNAMVGVSFVGDGVTAGAYTATYVAAWNSSKSVTTADILVNAYDAAVGDIFENPFVVTLPYTNAGVSTDLPMRSNYITPGTATNGKDVVYKFTLADDQEIDVTVTPAGANVAKIAIYAADFGGEAGPMVSNALVSGAAITSADLYAGDYYVVVGCEADDAAMTFDINITGATMPAPEKAFNPFPADGAVDVPSNGLTLTWEFGQYTNEYKLSFGTTYPPSTVLVDWTSDLATSFDLPNLDPSMQYFWQVEVKNNNGTVAADVWGFTTTVTAPTNLTATVVEIAMDEYNVVLNWDASAKALLSYNVYRDGVNIGTTAAGVDTYTDEDLAYNMNPCYEYTVEAVFDEGVSAMSNTASACITGVGTLNGTVTALLSGDPIQGATVAIDNGTWSTDVTTDMMGQYSFMVYEGTYDMTVSATDYITETRDDVDVAYGATVTEDFELDEFPYPVGDVTATEINDNTVQIDWSGTGGGSVADWLFYDDGVNIDGIGGPADFTWAIKFDADQLVDYPGCSVAKFQMYLRTNETIHFVVMQGDNAETVIYTEDFNGTIDQWNEFELTAPVSFDNSQALWFGVHTTQGTVYPASCGADMGEPNGDYITLDGSTWDHLSGYGLMYTWNLRGFVTDAGGKSYSMAKVNTPEYAKIPEGTFAAANVAPNGNASLPKTADVNAKDVSGYNVYRQVCNESAPMEFLGMTLDNLFTDNTWGTATWGTYKWAVETIYTNNVSEVTYSNCLDKDMVAVVDVTVNTNSGDAPEGCEILFTNTSEPGLELTYEIELIGTNTAVIEDFRKGTYNIDVVLNGFAEIHETDVLVDDDKSFEWLLLELLAPPTDLYVTPTGFATWTGGGAIPFEPLFEDFEGGALPEGWEMTTNSSAGWLFGANGSSSYWTIPAGDGIYAYSNDDAANDDSSVDYLITPLLDMSNLADATLMFSSYYDGMYSEVATIEVSVDGGAWTVVHTLATASSWTDVTVDLSAYDGESDVRVAFHADDSGFWASGWAVDNVTIDEAGKYADNKEFQFYKVFHNGGFSADRDTNFYQYGENETLVAGETYTACVSSLYSTGLSVQTCYDWTFVPCDDFPGWLIVDAYNVDESDDVLVSWTDMESFEPVWLQYDDGVNVDAIGGPAEFTYASKWDVDQLVDFAGTAVTKVKLFPREAGTAFTLKVFQGADAGTLVYEQALSGLTFDDWNEITLDTPVAIDNTQELWIGFYVVTGGYPAGCGDYVGEPNSDLITLDGTVWEHLADYGLNYSWNMGAYVEGGGKAMALPALTDNASYNSADATLAIGNLKPAANATDKSAKDYEVLGANVSRNGEFLAYVALPDTFLLDSDLEAGMYNYCVSKVYTADGGEHTWTSCEGVDCVEVEVTEDCNAPTELTVEDLLGDGITATLNWFGAGGSFDPLWLQYDDGVNVDAIGGPAEFTYASKWDADQLEDFDGTAITQVKLFPREAGTAFTLKIFSGDNAGTLLYEQPLSGLTFDDWNTVTLDTPVAIDITESIWIGFYVVTGGYPAGCGNYVGEPNSDLITLDGATWEHLQDYGLNYSWNMGVYVESAKGETVALPTLVDHATYSGNATVAVGNLPTSPNAVDQTTSAKEFQGYNVYRDGDQINEELVLETTYTDHLDAAGNYCYEITAVYSYCGESDPCEEVCQDIAMGVSNLDNSVNVYPNPANDFIKVEASSNIRSIEITNYMGQVVNSIKSVEFTQYTINTSDLSSGIYFVEVETTAGIEKVRIVISE